MEIISGFWFYLLLLLLLLLLVFSEVREVARLWHVDSFLVGIGRIRGSHTGYLVISKGGYSI
jgi:hypothetical protein